MNGLDNIIQYARENKELAMIVIASAVGLATVGVAKISSKISKVNKEKAERDKYGMDNPNNKYLNNTSSINQRVEEDESNEKITIDQFIRKGDTDNYYNLEAQVIEMYNVRDVGFSGILKDNTGKIPFICDTDNYSSEESAMIPILFDNSIKTGSPLTFQIDLNDNDFLIANISEITGTYNDKKYELNL